MNTLLEKAIKSGFLDLGFAEWVPNKGLQIQNLEKLNEDAPGVYIMHYKDKIQIFSNYSWKLMLRHQYETDTFETAEGLNQEIDDNI